jgi:aspartate dehydrogenase
MMPVLRLGLIGYGAIGRMVAAALAGEARLALTAALVRRERAEAGMTLTVDPDRFFAERRDAVLECAGHQAVRDHGERVLVGGADLIVTSVGALVDDALLARLRAAAERAGKRLIIPSAGVGALDILSAGAVGGLDRVAITVRKDPASWKGTPAEAAHDLDRLAAPVTLYDGPVRAGARLYPENVNIAAAAALAGIGLDRTRLIIIADPHVDAHVVELEAAGAFGRFRFVEEIVPTAANRKTGMLVGMAVVKTLRQMAASVVVAA